MSAVARKDVQRLGRLLGALGSLHDGERANAAALADRQLRSMGCTWEQLVRCAFTEPVLAFPPPRPLRRPPPNPTAQLRFVLSCWGFLNPWEKSFAGSLEVQRKPLSGAQLAKLTEVHERVSQRCGAAAEACP